MISLECLQKPGALVACQSCAVAPYCEEFRAILPVFAGKCGIDTQTGHAGEGGFSGFGPDERHDLFTDTLEAIEKRFPSYRGDCKFSTWAFQIFMNKKNDQLRKKYSAKKIFQYQPEDDEQEQDWDEWSSSQHRDPSTLTEDPLSNSDITIAIRNCYKKIMLMDKSCASLLATVYGRALSLIREDAGFEHASSESINFTSVLQLLASELETSFMALKRRFYRCRDRLDPLLRNCLEEAGYGSY